MMFLPNKKYAPILIAIFVILFLLGILVGYLLKPDKVSVNEINSFEDCAAAGYPIMESYPEQCRTPDGRNFTRDISNDPYYDDPNQVACTMDAMICPDGTAVGRVPPTCEFAPCPGN